MTRCKLKQTSKFVFSVLIPIALFSFSGCYTMKYTDDVVEDAHYEYCAKPFDSENERGYYIGTQEIEGSSYDVFVFKNLIKTDGDKYIKIALPHNDADWHEDQKSSSVTIIPNKSVERFWGGWNGVGLPTLDELDYEKSEWHSEKGLIISECGAEDFDEKKKLASAEISPAYMSTSLLFLSCVYYSPMHNEYSFGFFVPAKKVMSIYKKGRGFPTYLFTYFGYPGPILLDVITSPGQIFLWWCFRDFNLGG